jgi:hypothetical protein
VNLLGVSAFPDGVRRSQMDLIPEDGATLMQAARVCGAWLLRAWRGSCRRTGLQFPLQCLVIAFIASGAPAWPPDHDSTRIIDRWYRNSGDGRTTGRLSITANPLNARSIQPRLFRRDARAA